MATDPLPLLTSFQNLSVAIKEATSLRTMEDLRNTMKLIGMHTHNMGGDKTSKPPERVPYYESFVVLQLAPEGQPQDPNERTHLLRRMTRADHPGGRLRDETLCGLTMNLKHTEIPNAEGAEQHATCVECTVLAALHRDVLRER